MKYIIYLLLFVSSKFTFSQSDSVVVHFEKNSSFLTPSEILKLNVGNEIENIKIIGYCDYLGSNEYNLWLSKRRSERVKGIILRNGIESSKILISTGNGEIKAQTKELLGKKEDRKVVVYYSSKIINSKVSQEKPARDSIVDIPQLDSLEIGGKIDLPKLSFIGGRHQLADDADTGMDKLLTLLINYPNLKIAIEGHICCETKFDDGYDQQTGLYNLSTARAKAIYDLLLIEGIDSSRLTYEGFGRTMPLYPLEKDEFEQQANRRVEFKLLEK